MKTSRPPRYQTIRLVGEDRSYCEQWYWLWTWHGDSAFHRRLTSPNPKKFQIILANSKVPSNPRALPCWKGMMDPRQLIHDPRFSFRVLLYIHRDTKNRMTSLSGDYEVHCYLRCGLVCWEDKINRNWLKQKRVTQTFAVGTFGGFSTSIQSPPTVEEEKSWSKRQIATY